MLFDVGHVMVDNVLFQAEKLKHGMDTSGLETDAFKKANPRYAVVTLHRPSNVDGDENLRRVAGVLNRVAEDRFPSVFPVHPRTRKNLETAGIALGPRHHPDRPAALHGLPAHLEGRRPGADRQRRPAGRDHRAGRALRDHARIDRAARSPWMRAATSWPAPNPENVLAACLQVLAGQRQGGAPAQAVGRQGGGADRQRCWRSKLDRLIRPSLKRCAAMAEQALGAGRDERRHPGMGLS